MGIVVLGAVFIDIKGHSTSSYIPAGRNVGTVEEVHGGVSRNVVEDIANVELRPTFVSLVDESGIGTGVLEKLNNHKVDTIIQKMESQNKLKAKVIDNTNNKNYIRANSITDFYNTEMKKEFICPITQNIMEEPVITPFGMTYEKSAIIDWIKKNKTDFQTKNLLTEDMLVTNHILKVEIKEYKDSLNEMIIE